MGHVSRERRGYISYLIRLWQIRSAGELIWRASLESPSTGERWGFANLEDLFDFLQRQTGPAPDSGQAVDQIRGGDESTAKQSYTLA